LALGVLAGLLVSRVTRERVVQRDRSAFLEGQASLAGGACLASQDLRARLDPRDRLASRVRRDLLEDAADRDPKDLVDPVGPRATRETQVWRDSRGRRATWEQKALHLLAPKGIRGLLETREPGAPRGLRVFAAPRVALDLVVHLGRLG